ncbi:MAG TPA: OmpA family protein [Sphingomonas sp.]|uniref:OmpA family protein n=1 Tax=Sphingomonas sp. TaxID=28214 RepID=UPI002ED9A5A2
MRMPIIAAGLAAATLSSTFLAMATPASAQRIDWRPGAYRLVGAGAPDLYPELRGTPRGRAFVMRNFDGNCDGRVNRREAEAANRAFAGVAGPRRDRFDWNARDRVVVADGRGGWDRGAMRGYGFRDAPEGARLTLQEEVLFATDSATLRPGAIDRLRPLADYLRAEPGVRVAIDGHTDARASDQYNQDLSERRAASVRDALEDMGVVEARFRVRGYGETRPVAPNTTAAGLRRNRRVEVTLLGRRAAEFAGR